MTAKEARVELVNYHTDHIAEATVALIRNFIVYSGIYGTEQWGGAIIHLLSIIESQKPQQLSLNAEGIGISFSGFPNPRPRILEGNLVYEPREPRFTIEDRWDDILPRQRTRVARITSEIGEEMRNVFRMRVEYPPYTLIFPKQEFARERVVFNAAILQGVV
jgi:hypothetical protein